MKKLLVLGSLEEFTKLVLDAKKRGAFVYVCDRYADGPAKQAADKAFNIDVGETEAIARICQEEGIDSIITSFSDYLFECMVQICHLAGLKCYLTPQQLPYYRNKAVMKKLLKKLEIGTPAFTCIEADFNHQEIAHLSFPVVVKPLDRYGSRGVLVLNNENEIRDYFEESCATSAIKKLLVEEYDEGHEFNLMSWVKDGQVIILSIADREKTAIGGKEIPISTRNVYPSRLMNEVYQEAQTVLEKIVAETGQQQGPLSMQFFWSIQRGLQVCEFAGRCFGYEHELLAYSGGPEIEKLLLDYLWDEAELTKTLKTHNPFLPRCSAVLYFQGREQVINDLSAARAVLDRPEVKAGWLFYQEGERIERYVRPYTARYYITGQNREQLDALTAEIFAAISVKNENGEEILYKNKMPIY